jgi:uncharacterized protein YecT (DUF1311 family)
MPLKIMRVLSVFLATTAVAETSSQDLVIAIAPNNEFQLVAQSGRSAIWLAMTKNPEQPVALPSAEIEQVDSSGTTSRIVKVSSDSLETRPRCFISPDSRWIFVQINWSETGLLYRKIDNSSADQTTKFELAIPEGFDAAAWRFASKQRNVTDDLIGIPNQYGARLKSLSFAAWSADSGRLLVQMSGSVGKPKKPKGGGGPTEYDANIWQLCYFNTKTGTFERTDRLRKADAKKAPERRLDDKASEVNAVLEAESIGQESPEISAPQRLKKADGELNNVYQTLLKSLSPDRKAQFQDEQRSWLRERDLFAAIHANQSWSPFPNASRIEGAAISTESRVAELQKRLESVEKP